MDNTLKKRTLIWEENNEPPKNYIWMRNGVAYEYNYGTKSWEISKLISSNGGTDSNAMHAYEIASLDEVQTPKEGDLAIIKEVKIPVEGGQITGESVHISGDRYRTTWQINLDQSKTYLIEAGESADRIDQLYKGIIICGYIPSTSGLNKNFPIILTEATSLTMDVMDNWDGTSNPYINIYEYTPGESYEYFNGGWTSRGDTSLSELSETVLKRVDSIFDGKPGDVYVTEEKQGTSNIFSGLSTSNNITVQTSESDPVNVSTVNFTHFTISGFGINMATMQSADTIVTIVANYMGTYNSNTIYTVQPNGTTIKITDQDGNEYGANQPIPIPIANIMMGSMAYPVKCDRLNITESEGTTKLSSFLNGYLVNPASFNIFTRDNSAAGMPSSIISTTPQTGPVQYGSDSLVKSKDIYEYGKSLLDKSQRTYTISPESVTNPKEGDICNVPAQYNWISPQSTSGMGWAGNITTYIKTFDLNNWSNETLHVECTQYATYGSTQLIITYVDNSEETFDSFPINITNAVSAKTFGQMATYPVFAFGIKTADAQIKEYYNGEWVDRKATEKQSLYNLPTDQIVSPKDGDVTVVPGHKGEQITYSYGNNINTLNYDKIIIELPEGVDTFNGSVNIYDEMYSQIAELNSETVFPFILDVSTTNNISTSIFSVPAQTTVVNLYEYVSGQTKVYYNETWYNVKDLLNALQNVPSILMLNGAPNTNMTTMEELNTIGLTYQVIQDLANGKYYRVKFSNSSYSDPIGNCSYYASNDFRINIGNFTISINNSSTVTVTNNSQ